MTSYSSRVRADAARWVASGLIDGKTAQAIVLDVEAHDRRSLSFGSILAIMAALLFGAAILVFVASNWEAIPRLARVGALFAIIFAGYVGGAVLKLNDHAAIGEAVWLIAARAIRIRRGSVSSPENQLCGRQKASVTRAGGQTAPARQASGVHRALGLRQATGDWPGS